MIGDVQDASGEAACPVCGKPSRAAMQPFCSVRCADVDLGRWLTGQYRVSRPEEEDAPPDPDAA